MISTMIFDLDGTLIDTEKYYHKCWMEAVEHFGYSITHEQAYGLRSLGMPYLREYFRELYGPEFDVDTVKAYCRQLTDKAFSENPIELKPGAEELLRYLQEKKIRAAVATATAYERAAGLLKRLNIFDYFDRVVSAGMVERGKPAPDVYLHACRELEVEPKDCIAVEDSPNGVMSAYRAGCQVVMVPDQTEPDEKLRELLYQKVDSLVELKEYI